ncbi:NUDIX hydrolase [Litorilinea aerophila]|uniref:NUDIX hydrolase n=1 Tax=Litorilinea aerophila TaxID=1204385 RepID=A0A540VGV2_9CHLR|nr:NUDIX domain-containing protein [Litorilinea aerophila]MCC9076383.1 NUDIX hydrolase [Litorilinea aerophila]OUC06915.1 NUDIX hydrolase [Litorilinea aerophila]GIV79135.1 MAG: NUDIX hydrolase [Litorilinea sp.]
MTSTTGTERPRPYCYEFPRPAVTVDIILFTFKDNQLQVLLIQRNHPPFEHMWALPGGFVEMDEDLEAAALRELREETNITDVYLEQLYTFGQPDRDPRTRVITVAYFALLSADQAARLQVRGQSDAREARWWSVYNLPPLAFDHRRIIEYAVQRLRWKLEWTALGFLLLPEEFTLSELQKVYETVLNEPLDKRNFRRKMLAADVLEETGNLREGDHRPAKLYRFTAKAIELEQARRRFP